MIWAITKKPKTRERSDIRRRNTNELAELVTKSRTVLSSFAKAKTAKLSTEFSSW